MTALPLLVALFVSGAFADPIFRWLLAAKSRQTINKFAPEGHQAKQGTPTMGGLIILVGALAGICTLFALKTVHRESVISAVLVLLGFGFIGFTDDFIVPRVIKGSRGLEWKQKLLMQVVFGIVGLLPVYGFNQPLHLGAGLFFILFFSNAYNFSDGLDALAGTILLAFAAGSASVGFITGNDFALQVSLILATAVIPFLFLNAPPARVFMGDAGSLPIGALLGLVVISLGESILTGYRLSGLSMAASKVNFDRAEYAQIPVGVGILSLIVLSTMIIAELVPVPLQILSVKLRKKKLFPYTPIHHAFEKAGWPETRVTFMFALIQLVASMMAVALVVLGTSNFNGPK